MVKFGFARRVITPQVPLSLAGYFTLRMWDHVLDDIYVQALALEDGDGSRVALVQLDLVSPAREIVEPVRSRCAGIEGLDPENIVFTASHTHTAPVVRGERPGGNPDYVTYAVDQVTEAVQAAVDDLKPGRVATGMAQESRFAFNRRYWMNDGNVVTNPPRRSSDIQKPEGPIDPEIPLLQIQDDQGKGILLANIANHPDTIDGCGVSADWHGFVRGTIEAARPDIRVITLTGCAGNLNHFNPNGPDDQSGYDTARRIGEGYAESILSVLDDLTPSQSSRVSAAAAELRVGPREISEEELAEARKHADMYTFDTSRQLTSEDLATGSPAALKYFADHLIAVAEDRSDRTFEVHAVNIGDAVLVVLPGEPFTEHGIAIRHEILAGRPALVAALGDGRAVYIPNAFNYGRGGYETTPRCSPYSTNTGQRLRDTVREMVERLPRD